MSNDIDLVCERLDRLESTLRALVASGAGANVPIDTTMTMANQPEERLTPADQVATLPVRPAAKAADGVSKEATLATVEAIIVARKWRLNFFENDLFFDPVWAILIDLFRAELKGERLSVSSVCYGSGVAQTTALRYIYLLEERGYVDRIPDERDKRRAFLKLSESAHDRLESYFAHLVTNCIVDYRLVA